MATRIAKGFHRDEALGESPAVPFVPSTLGGNHYWCQMSKQRPSDNREAHAAGQLLAGLNQTKIPGNVDASAIRRSFAQRAFIGTKCQMNLWSAVFSFPREKERFLMVEH